MNTENNIKMKELAEHFRREQPHLMRYAYYRLGDTDDAKDALQKEVRQRATLRVFPP